MSRLPPYEFAGGTAVVTGAASGIGAELARGLAARGSHLALVDRDEARLATVVEAIRGAGGDTVVTSHPADLAHTAAVPDLAARILIGHPRITLLVNNAGVALGGRFDQVSLAEFEEVLRVNFAAPVALTSALLPALTAQPGGHVVNVSSVFGLVAPPGQTAYAASKFALRGFSEALGAELLDRGTGVTTVHPGGVRTRIAESARRGMSMPAEEFAAGLAAITPQLSYPPKRAAEEILAAVHRRRRRLLITRTALAIDLGSRLAPVTYGRLLRWAVRSAERR